jgi:hypothetical protein
MLNQPVDRETAIFKPEWLRYRPFEVLEQKQSGAMNLPVSLHD